MSGNQFDRQIASKLRGYSHPVSEKLWQAVEAGIRDDNKGSGYAWLGVAFLMLMFTGIIATTMPRVLENPKPEVHISLNQSGIAESVNAQKDNPEASHADQMNGQSVAAGSGKDMPFTETIENTFLAPSAHLDGSDIKESEAANAHLYANNIGINLETDKRKGQYPDAHIGQLLVQPDNEEAINTGSVGLHNAHTSRERFTAFSLLKHNFLAVIQSDNDRLTVATLQKLRTDCYSFDGRQPGRFFIDVYAGGAYPVYQFESKNEFVPGYIQARDSTESMRASFALGLRGGYQLNAKLSVLGGLHLTQINRVFDFYNPSAQEYDTVYTEIKIISGQDTTITIDTSYTLVAGERYKTTYNKYTTLDIPILLGYEFISRNWQVAVKAGPVINIMYRQKGDFLAPDGTPVNFSSDNSNAYPAYKSNIGFSLYTSLHVSRRVGFRTYLFAEPYLLYRLEDLTIDSYPVSEHQEIFGLSFGVRVKI